MKTRTQAQVEARNAIAKKHNELLNILRAAFAPLVGKKILKADGYLMEKFKHLEPVGDKQFTIYKLSSNYSLAFCVKTCVCYGESHCLYDEVCVYVGELQGGILAKLMDDPEKRILKSDYTVEGVEQARQAVKDAEDKLSAAKSALHPFEIR